MQKRGDSHVDWVISVGIFLVYVVTLLAFIKLTYKPIYEGEVLLNILQNNFEEKYVWNMTKIPIFVTGSTEESCFENPNNKNFKLKLIEFTNPSWDKKNMFIKKDGKFIDFDIESGNSGSKTLTIRESSLGVGEKLNYEIYNGKPIDYTNNGGLSDPAFKLENYGCAIAGSCIELTASCITHVFGVPETLMGIKETKLDKNEKEDLTLGNRLGIFPLQKNYNITIYKKEGNKEVPWSIANKPGQPPVNIQVYVKNYKDWMLKNDSTKEAVTINIRAW